MFGTKQKICPRIGKPCLKQECEDWIMIPCEGKTPETVGKTVEQWDCAARWNVHMMREVAFRTRNMTAATESYRNEQKGFFSAFAAAVNNAGQKIHALAEKMTTPQLEKKEDPSATPS